MPDRSMILAILTGVALAAACGLRAFLPLLVAGVAARLGLIHLGTQFEWLAGNPALVALGLAAALEIAGDKIPVVDHALDLAGTVVRPVAAAFVVLGVMPHLPGPIAALIAVICGAGALGVHAVKAKARLGSTALTLGHLNPVLSFAEDGITMAIVALAVLIPVAAIAALAIVLWALSRRRAPRPA